MSDSATMSVRALHRTDLPKLSLSTKAAATVLAIVAAVALPQLFHVIGAVSGQGTMLGVAFLPMHLPIIFVGLIAGPAVAGVFLSGRSPPSSAKPPGDALERSLKCGLLDLDFAETGLQRDPADALGLACLGCFELILEPGDFFPDLR